MRVQPDGSAIVAVYGFAPMKRIIISPAPIDAGRAGVTDVLPEAHAPGVRLVMLISVA